MQEIETNATATAHGGEPLVSDLEESRRQMEAVNADARDLIEGLSETQVNWRPTPNHWSIAECLDHLTVTNRELLAGVKAAIKDARARGLTASGPFRYGLIGQWVVRSMEPPAKMKFKAPKIFKPRPIQSLEAVARDFFMVQDEVVRLMFEANGLDLKRVKVTSPVTRFFKLSLGQVFDLIATHNRRHLWQARRVKDDPAFPSAEAAI